MSNGTVETPPEMPEKLKSIEKFFTYLLAVLGTPIRGLFNTIGNSVVTAWTLICITALLIFGVYLSVYTDMDLDKSNAYARERNAQAEGRELLNKEKAANVKVVGNFGAISVTQVDETYSPGGAGIVLKFAPVRSAVAYEAQWKINGQGQDLLTLTAPGDASAMVTWHIPVATFGSLWESGKYIQFVLYARDSDGYHSKTSQTIGIRIP